MKIRALISVWLLALMGLAMCGAGLPDIGLSSNRGKLGVGLRTSLARGGGGSAGWDTVTVMYSPEARVVTAIDLGNYPENPAGVDTFPRPASASADDIARITIMNSRLLGRDGTRYSFRDGPSDSARCYRLGTGFDVPTFAYAVIDTATPAGYKAAAGYYNSLSGLARSLLSGNARLNMNFVGATRRTELVYLPFAEIPDNATIVSAVMNMSCTGSFYFGISDTLISTLIDNPADSYWYTEKGGVANYPDYAETSYRQQHSAAWGGTAAHPWVPELKSRRWYWDWGKISDWTGGTDGNPPYVSQAGLDISIANCLQAVAAGSVNNGISLNFSPNNTSTEDFNHYVFDDYSSALRRTPYVFTKYITKRYLKPFGVSDLVFCFQTDDGNPDANSAFTDTFLAHGGKYTIFVARTQVLPNAGRAAEVMGYHAAGMEIGSHSMDHSGMNAAPWNAVADTFNSGAAGDTLWSGICRDVSREWMYVMADSIVGDLRGDPNFGRTFGAPVTQLTPYSQIALERAGYDAWRGLSNDTTFDREKYYGLMTPRADGDSLVLAAPSQYGRHVRNMSLTRQTHLVNALFGFSQLPAGGSDSTSASLTHLPKVRDNARRALFTARGQQTGMISTFTHDLKSGTNYADGVNGDDLGAFLDVLDEWGVPSWTTGDYIRWIKAGATAIDYPFGAAKADTFRQQASDRVWFKPNGIDNRWIRSVRLPATVAAAFDVTAPPAPVLTLATPQDGSASVTWDASATAEPVIYKLYRLYDGSTDTTLVATTANLTATSTEINGTPCNYFVTAQDAAGNVSVPSNTMATTPHGTLSLTTPPVFAFWYQDPKAATFAQATIDSIAAFDVVVQGPFSLMDQSSHPAYTAGDSLINRLRATNPDQILLTYFSPFTIPGDGNLYPAGSFIKRAWDYCVSVDADSSGFAEKVGGGTVGGDVYDTKFYNVSIPATADTLARYLVDSFQRSGADGQYAGFFADDTDTTLSAWMCNSGDCQNWIDYDQNGSDFNTTTVEKELVKDWHIRFLQAIRREFAERGLTNRLIVGNTTFGRKATPNLKDDDYMALVDGMLNESWNLYWPGPATATDTAKWDLAFGWKDMLTHAQTAPPLYLMNAAADSSLQYMGQVMAFAAGGAGNAQAPGTGDSAPYLPYRGPAFTYPGTVTYQEVAADASPDTMTVTDGTYTARMILGPASGVTIWPYIVYNPTTNDTLSISAFWERAADIGAPDYVQFATLCNSTPPDNYVPIEISLVGSGDFDHYTIYRSLVADLDSMTVLDADPDFTPGGTSTFIYRDSTATNNTEYFYTVTATDFSGNEGPMSDFDSCSPSDAVAPPVPLSVMASGGGYYVDVDWLNATAADLVGYYVARAPDSGGSPGTYTARYDSTTASAYQDSTAISGQTYWYKVRSYDDDGNISAYSSAVFGSWLGTVPTTYPAPSNIIAHADLPAAGQVSVVIYPPSDATGLTSYSLYKTYWSSGAADSSACTLYKTGLAPDGFNGHVFVDTHISVDADSSYQYTAKALYSGHASEKYAVPSIVHAYGAFPSSTPAIGAAGQTSGIAVFWNVISGADSTRIYRGTTAGTQTSLVSVNALNNPYSDTSALANTSYYYKVREYDNTSATWTNYSAVFGPVSWVSVPSGSPTIASVSGTISHGSAVTLTGSSFGAKATAAPVAYDGFESGSFAAAWTMKGHPTNLMSITQGGSNARTGATSRYVEADLNGTNVDVNGFQDAAFACGSDAKYWFVQYWFKFDADWDFGNTGESGANSNNANLKFIRFTSTGGDDNSFFYSWNGWEGTTAKGDCPSAYGGVDWYSDGPSGNDMDTGGWHLFQFEYIDSDASTENGSVKWWVDGQLVEHHTGMSTSGGSQKRPAYIGFPNAWPANTNGSNHVYMDDVYADNTFARVELGTSTSNPTNPTYAQCDHREIQVPTSWAGGAIGITLNTGSFANGTAYLFVITEDGTVSAGKAVTISN